MVSRLPRLGRPTLPDEPAPADFDGALPPQMVDDALATLKAERAAERLDWYRQMHTHTWLIWLPSSVVPGGQRVTLPEWCVLFYPTCRLQRQHIGHEGGRA